MRPPNFHRRSFVSAVLLGLACGAPAPSKEGGGVAPDAQDADTPVLVDTGMPVPVDTAPSVADSGSGSGSDSGSDSGGSTLGDCPDALDDRAELIPSQTFEMGCTAAQEPDCDPVADPPRSVTLTHCWFMERSEVVQAEFERVMGYAPSVFSGCGADCPVESVTWHEAAAYANARSLESGLDLCYDCVGDGAETECLSPADPYACEGWRLPTEAEWEAAARCGTDTRFAGSDTLDAVACTITTAGAQTHPVGGLAPNDCGLVDMTGNVWEWTQDWFGGDAGTLDDPAGGETGSAKVYRGGSWGSGAGNARVAYRTRISPAYRDSHLGFRLARIAAP